MNDGYEWIVDIDLEKFFDNVPHDRLLRLVSDIVKDGNVISLVNKFLKAGVMEKGNYEETTIGTPQGGPLSPLLSNIMLNLLDKELEARNLRFTRYADDTIILVKSEKAANRVMASITKFIENKLKLKVNMTKTKVCTPWDLNNARGLAYCRRGYTFVAHSQILQKAISKERLQNQNKKLGRRGLVFALDYYLA